MKLTLYLKYSTYFEWYKILGGPVVSNMKISNLNVNLENGKNWKLGHFCIQIKIVIQNNLAYCAQMTIVEVLGQPLNVCTISIKTFFNGFFEIISNYLLPIFIGSNWTSITNKDE